MQRLNLWTCIYILPVVLILAGSKTAFQLILQFILKLSPQIQILTKSATKLENTCISVTNNPNNSYDILDLV